MMGYLRLVREAPVEDLIGLMKRMDREYPGDCPGDFVRNAIYKRLLGEDPEALLKATLESPTEGLMWRRGKIIDLMAERDFEGTMDKILEVRNQKHRTIFLGTLLSWRGREDFAEALRWCETIDDVDPYQLVGDLLEEVEAENAGEALDAMLASRHADVTDGIRSLFYKWSRHDRDAALAYVAKLRTHSQREKAIRGIAVRWAHEEPKVAREYAEGIESEQLRTVFLVSMLDTYGVKGAEALETVLAIPHLEKREGHLFPEFMKWSMENPTLAAEWAHEHGLEYLLERIPPTPRDNAIQGAVIDGLLEKIEIVEEVK